MVLLFLIAAYLMFFVLVREAFRWRWVRSLHRSAREERLRNSFGEVRTVLMTVAREGGVDVRSELFKGIYISTTLFMRNPSSFEEASSRLLAVVPKVDKNKRLHVSREMVPVFIGFAVVLGELLQEFAPLQYKMWRFRLSSMWRKNRAFEAKARLESVVAELRPAFARG